MRHEHRSYWVALYGITLLLITGCGGSVVPFTPSKPTQPTCSVDGTSAPAAQNEWTWMSGANVANQAGTYGTQGVAASANTPGARAYPVTWTDKCGVFWLFGGYGAASTASQGDLNDLWEYTGGQWTWVTGSNLTEQSGVYGTLGVPAANNVPGARYQAVSWIDAQGNLWLFGGLGKDSAGNRGDLNDLWRYSAGQWTWMSGSNLASSAAATQPGIYGTLGVPAPANTPAARGDANSWSDPSGNLWLFGGFGADSAGNLGLLNDLWKFSNGQWTWVAGSNLANQYGVYGTLGTPALSNSPGARTNAVTWTDLSGDLWLFGGAGDDANGLICVVGPCNLNDLWKFSEGQWTWMGGSNLVNQPGAYGIQGVASPGNHPGARWGSYSWIDASGNLWLFGGNGLDSTVGPPEIYGDLNDLWEYTNGQWIWASGSNKAQLFTGTYGTLGVPAATNLPGVRDSGASWIDLTGNLWLFGGGNYSTIATNAGGGKLNDLWEYQTWGVAGPPTQPVPTTYTIGGSISGLSGTLVLQDDNTDDLTLTADGTFTFHTAITPGSAYSVTALTQPANPTQYCSVANASGIVTAAVTNIQITCTTITSTHSEWTWVSGADSVGAPGIYGILGVATPANVPGARNAAATWTDASGNLWLFGGTNGGFGNQLIGPGGQQVFSYSDFNDLWKFSNAQWTWMGGSNTTTYTQPSVYGTKGVAAPTNQPGARHSAVTWTDASGNFWLFGGIGVDSTGAQGYMNDLWQFTAGQWTWIAGSNLANQPGTYGTQGMASPANSPGARGSAVTWTDASGTLWLFGGIGYDSTNSACYLIYNKECFLNDLWKFSSGQWTWVVGSNIVNQSGTYGTLGASATSNVPGARLSAIAWRDTSGTLWLFGGAGLDSSGTTGFLDDLWKYNGGQWTRVAGANIINQPGTYGTQGIAAAGNIPGARSNAASWTDASGNLWLLGGNGLASTTSTGDLNDLWKFSNGQWTWVGGSNQINQLGTYGILGVAYPANVPGSRDSASSWIDPSGNLWLFGGAASGQDLNDLWKYQP
jgi:N-acetylneuraminic acid mutarotase